VSGNGLNATQTTPSYEPTFVTNAINGLPGIGFSGFNQWFVIPTGFSNFTAGLTYFVVAEPIALTDTYNRLIDLGTTGPGEANSIPLYQPAASTLAFSVYGNPDTNVTTVQSSSALALGLYQLFEVTHDGVDTGTIYVNGVPLAQNTAMGTIPNVSRTTNCIAQFGQGGPFFFNGQIAEILVYNQILTSAQRLNVENYLLNRYYGQTAAAAPIFSLPTSTLPTPNQVAISGPPGSAIYFTVDGTTPTQSSPSYSGGPIQINYTQTVKAISVINGISSSVASATYTLPAQYPAPSSGDTRPLTINLQLPATAQ
jgi:Concanavalin A-like lectin/glucanases superfamily/Fn3 associated